MRKRSAVAAVLALGLLGGIGGSIGHADTCPADVDAASASSPHVTDGANDWNGELGGTTTVGVVPAGDVYREGTDIVGAWIYRDASGLHGAIQVQDLPLVAENAFFYLLWTRPDPDPSGADESRRFLSARLHAYKPADFTWGYFGADPTLPTSGSAFWTQGTTTGSVTPGPGGTMVIDIPDAAIPNAQAGESLSGIVAEGRVLVGSPEALPQPPSPYRHGFVFVADTTEDGALQCDAIL